MMAFYERVVHVRAAGVRRIVPRTTSSSIEMLFDCAGKLDCMHVLLQHEADPSVPFCGFPVRNMFARENQIGDFILQKQLLC